MAEAEKYEVLEQIGHGSFGVIRKVRRKSDGHVLCRKEINYVRMSQKEREQLHSEFSILNSLHHPNIVGYYHREHLKATQDLHLYMEYCGNGDLGRVIKNLKANNQYAEEEFVWSIFSQLVTALYRCHYGDNPPEVGRNVMGLGNEAKPKPKGQVMILHRDLKPENVFLGADNSVKLGDFGLSKIMQSHDFASTYVGTPFYMSPEICAAEKYTLHSDIWSLGCIMYELCAREPPFNAKTHLQLCQKIKDGKIPPLPHVYSPELQSVVRSCLKVDPKLRPETSTLLNLPVVKLMRKEREVVELGRLLKSKEELAKRKARELDERAARIDMEREKMRREVDASVRREWELKARLEIDRQVKGEMERLQRLVEMDFQEKVQHEVQRQLRTLKEPEKGDAPAAGDDIPLSSVSTNGESDFPSTTDLTELSLNSPVAQQGKASRKTTRTPFSRSRTMVEDSPMDVQMVDPSPMSIASLSLSPRRTAPGKRSAKNIFAAAAEEKPMAAFEDEDEDDLPPLPSPTRQKGSNNPFRTARPPLVTQKTAPLQKLSSQPNLFGPPTKKANPQPDPPSLRPTTSERNALNEKKATSPNRRLSKIPSSTALLANESGSPVRKAKKAVFAAPASAADDMVKAVTKNNFMKGRTLVELAQARAGGRPMEDVDPEAAAALADKARVKKRQTIGEGGGAIKFAARGGEVVWDPERDEMPSPFLIRGGGRAGRGF
ncbi:MAG: G2-specific serine/threonine protein kinase [Thelocarpon impressellum]|nr:MAG: G2-specific serine/threonine protein kinase [Thelocarpon impressellum]